MGAVCRVGDLRELFWVRCDASQHRGERLCLRWVLKQLGLFDGQEHLANAVFRAATTRKDGQCGEQKCSLEAVTLLGDGGLRRQFRNLNVYDRWWGLQRDIRVSEPDLPTRGVRGDCGCKFRAQTYELGI